MTTRHPHDRLVTTPPRRGTTLVEVMFSIGVVLIGLVGLAAVIPVAGRQAEDSVALNTGSALADSAFQTMTSRGFDQPNQWVWKDASGGYVPVIGGGNVPLTNAPAYCLDPLFLAASIYPTDSTGYDRTRFPFYQTTYNPLVDPSMSITSPWPVQPRLYRVSVDRASQPLAQVLTQKEAEAVVESGDGLSQNMPKKDDTLRPEVSGLATGSTVGYGKRMTSGKYTWFATVNKIPGTSSAEVCTVIVKSRDRSFFTAQNGDPPAATAKDNASSERLAYVEASSGFSGGAGGTVTIVASDKVESKIIPNSWVMLSRRITSGPPPVDVHQWYRVTGAIGDAEEMEAYPDPVVTGSSYPVWRQQLMLDGPDWDFSGLTVMTIVEDVVSVTRHTVPFGS